MSLDYLLTDKYRKKIISYVKIISGVSAGYILQGIYTIFMGESEEKLKNVLIKVKEGSEKPGLKLRN